MARIVLNESFKQYDFNIKRLYNENYQSPEWKEKRKEILYRDDYTCQKCGTFDPSMGLIIKFKTTIEPPHFDGIDMYWNGPETHEYNRYSGEYTIQKDGMTITIPFSPHKIVMPILQVHHKKYIKNRELWEYSNDDLVTLCENCHNKEHVTNNIPCFDSENKKVISYTNLIYTDLDKFDSNYIFRNFKPWSFVHENEKNIYVYSKSIKINNLEIIDIGVNRRPYLYHKIYQYFIMRYFPDYELREK